MPDVAARPNVVCTWNNVRQAGILLVAIVFLFPFFWMVSNALRLDREVFVVPPQLLPETTHWFNFVEAWRYLPFGTFFFNSAFVSGSITAITLMLVCSKLVRICAIGLM